MWNKDFLYKITVFSVLLIMSGCSSSEGKNDPVSDDHSANGKVMVYTYSSSVKPSTYYTVKVQEQDAFVLPTSEPQICSFSCEGKVKVEVTPLRTQATSAMVRPVTKNYEYSVSNGNVILYLEPYDRVVVEINGDEENPLFLFANPMETDKPSGDNADVLYYKAGTVTSESILSLKSGQTLYVEGGAILKGCVWAQNCSDVTIKGCGIIDARDNSDKVVFFNHVTDGTIENVTVLNSTGWTTLLTQSSNITSDNYKAVAVASSNSAGNQNDAFDVLGCSGVKVTRGFSYCHDDAFCVKSQKWIYNAETKDVSFEDCIAWNKECGNSFEVGYETNQNVSKVSFKDVYAIHSAGKRTPLRRGGIGVHQGAGALISDLTYENVYIEDPKEYGVYIRIMNSGYDIGTGEVWQPGLIKGVTLKNVRFLSKPPYGNVIQGYDSSHRIEGIKFENLHIGDDLITNQNAGSYFTISNAEVTFSTTE